MQRGEVTAFLSLIFVLLISFITAILESTSIQVSKNQKRLDVDSAVYSLFGEYQKELLKEYELLAIDGSYGTEYYDEQNLVNRLYYYGTIGIEHDIKGIQYLTDKNGSSFREQVMEYMEQSYGISIIRDMTGKTATWKEQDIQGEEANESEKEFNVNLEEFMTEREASLPYEDNPLPHIAGLKKTSILQLVLPEGYQLSGKQINAEAQVSKRELRKGTGSFYIRQDMDSIEGRLLFHEYLLRKFGNAVEPKKNSRNLSYELEYVIEGKSSDKENLEMLVKKLLGIRFGMNFIYLQTDSVKQAEAEALALSLSTLAGFPGASPLVKQVLLAAWSYGESIMDLRALMSGKKASLIKSSENWQLSLSGLMLLGTEGDAQDGMDAEGGLTYQEYLRIILFLQNENQMAMRSLDRVEENIKVEMGVKSFKADSCVVKIRLENKAEIRHNLTYQFPVYFEYR